MANEELIWSEKPSAKPGCKVLCVRVTLENGSVYSDERVIETDTSDRFSNVMRGYMREMALHALRKSRRVLVGANADSPSTFHSAPQPMTAEQLDAIKPLPI
jgi:hypothetical protein